MNFFGSQFEKNPMVNQQINSHNEQTGTEVGDPGPRPGIPPPTEAVDDLARLKKQISSDQSLTRPFNHSTRFHGHFIMDKTREPLYGDSDGSFMEASVRCTEKDSNPLCTKNNRISRYRIRLEYDFDPHQTNPPEPTISSIELVDSASVNKPPNILAELKPILRTIVGKLVQTHHSEFSSKQNRRLRSKSLDIRSQRSSKGKVRKQPKNSGNMATVNRRLGGRLSVNEVMPLVSEVEAPADFRMGALRLNSPFVEIASSELGDGRPQFSCKEPKRECSEHILTRFYSAEDSTTIQAENSDQLLSQAQAKFSQAPEPCTIQLPTISRKLTDVTPLMAASTTLLTRPWSCICYERMRPGVVACAVVKVGCRESIVVMAISPRPTFQTIAVGSFDIESNLQVHTETVKASVSKPPVPAAFQETRQDSKGTQIGKEEEDQARYINCSSGRQRRNSDKYYPSRLLIDRCSLHSPPSSFSMTLQECRLQSGRSSRIGVSTHSFITPLNCLNLRQGEERSAQSGRANLCLGTEGSISKRRSRSVQMKSRRKRSQTLGVKKNVTPVERNIQFLPLIRGMSVEHVSPKLGNMNSIPLSSSESNQNNNSGSKPFRTTLICTPTSSNRIMKRVPYYEIRSNSGWNCPRHSQCCCCSGSYHYHKRRRRQAHLNSDVIVLMDPPKKLKKGSWYRRADQLKEESEDRNSSGKESPLICLDLGPGYYALYKCTCVTESSLMASRKEEQEKPKDGKPKDEKPKDGKPKDEKPKDEKSKDEKPEKAKPDNGKPNMTEGSGVNNSAATCSSLASEHELMIPLKPTGCESLNAFTSSSVLNSGHNPALTSSNLPDFVHFIKENRCMSVNQSNLYSLGLNCRHCEEFCLEAAAQEKIAVVFPSRKKLGRTSHTGAHQSCPKAYAVHKFLRNFVHNELEATEAESKTRRKKIPTKAVTYRKVRKLGRTGRHQVIEKISVHHSSPPSPFQLQHLDACCGTDDMKKLHTVSLSYLKENYEDCTLASKLETSTKGIPAAAKLIYTERSPSFYSGSEITRKEPTKNFASIVRQPHLRECHAPSALILSRMATEENFYDKLPKIKYSYLECSSSLMGNKYSRTNHFNQESNIPECFVIPQITQMGQSFEEMGPELTELPVCDSQISGGSKSCTMGAFETPDGAPAASACNMIANAAAKKEQIQSKIPVVLITCTDGPLVEYIEKEETTNLADVCGDEEMKKLALHESLLSVKTALPPMDIIPSRIRPPQPESFDIISKVRRNSFDAELVNPPQIISLLNYPENKGIGEVSSCEQSSTTQLSTATNLANLAGDSLRSFVWPVKRENSQELSTENGAGSCMLKSCPKLHNSEGCLYNRCTSLSRYSNNLFTFRPEKARSLDNCATMTLNTVQSVDSLRCYEKDKNMVETGDVSNSPDPMADRPQTDIGRSCGIPVTAVAYRRSTSTSVLDSDSDSNSLRSAKKGQEVHYCDKPQRATSNDSYVSSVATPTNSAENWFYDSYVKNGEQERKMVKKFRKISAASLTYVQIPCNQEDGSIVIDRFVPEMTIDFSDEEAEESPSKEDNNCSLGPHIVGSPPTTEADTFRVAGSNNSNSCMLENDKWDPKIKVPSFRSLATATCYTDRDFICNPTQNTYEWEALEPMVNQNSMSVHSTPLLFCLPLSRRNAEAGKSSRKMSKSAIYGNSDICALSSNYHKVEDLVERLQDMRSDLSFDLDESSCSLVLPETSASSSSEDESSDEEDSESVVLFRTKSAPCTVPCDFSPNLASVSAGSEWNSSGNMSSSVYNNSEQISSSSSEIIYNLSSVKDLPMKPLQEHRADYSSYYNSELKLDYYHDSLKDHCSIFPLAHNEPNVNIKIMNDTVVLRPDRDSVSTFPRPLSDYCTAVGTYKDYINPYYASRLNEERLLESHVSEPGDFGTEQNIYLVESARIPFVVPLYDYSGTFEAVTATLITTPQAETSVAICSDTDSVSQIQSWTDYLRFSLSGLTSPVVVRYLHPKICCSTDYVPKAFMSCLCEMGCQRFIHYKLDNINCVIPSTYSRTESSATLISCAEEYCTQDESTDSFIVPLLERLTDLGPVSPTTMWSTHCGHPRLRLSVTVVDETHSSRIKRSTLHIVRATERILASHRYWETGVNYSLKSHHEQQKKSGEENVSEEYSKNCAPKKCGDSFNYGLLNNSWCQQAHGSYHAVPGGTRHGRKWTMKPRRGKKEEKSGSRGGPDPKTRLCDRLKALEVRSESCGQKIRGKSFSREDFPRGKEVSSKGLVKRRPVSHVKKQLDMVAGQTQRPYKGRSYHNCQNGSTSEVSDKFFDTIDEKFCREKVEPRLRAQMRRL